MSINLQHRGPSGDVAAPQPASARQVPDDIKACLTPEQIARLDRLIARRSKRAVDYQISSSIFGRRFYLALFAGSEVRSELRLRQDGLRQPFWTLLINLGLVCIPVTVLICFLTGAAVVALYVMKSFLGIDLLEGPSFLHDYFCWR